MKLSLPFLHRQNIFLLWFYCLLSYLYGMLVTCDTKKKLKLEVPNQKRNSFLNVNGENVLWIDDKLGSFIEVFIVLQ